jgi:hypothetical protein
MGDLRGALNAMRQVMDEHGGDAQPQEVVDAARPEEHPLHDRFVWDDAVAGEAYRRVQAADLIRSFRVTYVAGDGRERDVRAFVVTRSRHDPGRSAYAPVEDVMADPFARQLVLRDMERDWRRLLARYHDMAEFAEIVRHDLGEGGAA